MSEHFLIVIPADPFADVPKRAEDVRTLLGKIVGTHETRVKDYGKLQFIDCGENFKRTGCPNCRRDIAMSDWHAWMDEDWHGEDGFHLHPHQTPCCNTSVTLNHLIYEARQGFARWFVSARNKSRRSLSDAEITQLEQVAELNLIAIAQKY